MASHSQETHSINSCTSSTESKNELTHTQTLIKEEKLLLGIYNKFVNRLSEVCIMGEEYSEELKEITAMNNELESRRCIDMRERIRKDVREGIGEVMESMRNICEGKYVHRHSIGEGIYYMGCLEIIKVLLWGESEEPLESGESDRLESETLDTVMEAALIMLGESLDPKILTQYAECFPSPYSPSLSLETVFPTYIHPILSMIQSHGERYRKYFHIMEERIVQPLIFSQSLTPHLIALEVTQCVVSLTEGEYQSELYKYLVDILLLRSDLVNGDYILNILRVLYLGMDLPQQSLSLDHLISLSSSPSSFALLIPIYSPLLHPHMQLPLRGNDYKSIIIHYFTALHSLILHPQLLGHTSLPHPSTLTHYLQAISGLLSHPLIPQLFTHLEIADHIEVIKRLCQAIFKGTAGAIHSTTLNHLFQILNVLIGVDIDFKTAFIIFKLVEKYYKMDPAQYLVNMLDLLKCHANLQQNFLNPPPQYYTDIGNVFKNVLSSQDPFIFYEAINIFIEFASKANIESLDFMLPTSNIGNQPFMTYFQLIINKKPLSDVEGTHRIMEEIEGKMRQNLIEMMEKDGWIINELKSRGDGEEEERALILMENLIGIIGGVKEGISSRYAQFKEGRRTEGEAKQILKEFFLTEVNTLP